MKQPKVDQCDTKTDSHLDMHDIKKEGENSTTVLHTYAFNSLNKAVTKLWKTSPI